MLRPGHEASPGQAARSLCTPQAGPERSEAAEQPPTQPASAALRCAGAAASCPPRRGGPTGPPCHRFQPSRPTALVGRCGQRHRHTDTDARVCRRGRIVLGRSSLHHVLRKGFFYITVANSDQLRSPGKPTSDPATPHSPRHEAAPAPASYSSPIGPSGIPKERCVPLIPARLLTNDR